MVEAGTDSVHDDIATFLGVSPLNVGIAIAGYRPVRRKDQDDVDVWAYPLAIGQQIPAVPLALRGGPTIVLDLEATYTEAIHDLGL
jgi:hypothetical protein